MCSGVVLQDASTLMLFNSFGCEKATSPFLLFEKALSIKQTSHLQQYIYMKGEIRKKKGNKKEERGKEGSLAWK